MKAMTAERAHGFWSYKAAPPPADPPFEGWTRDQWESLSPGMRREIARNTHLYAGAQHDAL